MSSETAQPMATFIASLKNLQELRCQFEFFAVFLKTPIITTLKRLHLMQDTSTSRDLQFISQYTWLESLTSTTIARRIGPSVTITNMTKLREIDFSLVEGIVNAQRDHFDLMVSVLMSTPSIERVACAVVPSAREPDAWKQLIQKIAKVDDIRVQRLLTRAKWLMLEAGMAAGQWTWARDIIAPDSLLGHVMQPHFQNEDVSDLVTMVTSMSFFDPVSILQTYGGTPSPLHRSSYFTGRAALPAAVLKRLLRLLKKYKDRLRQVIPSDNDIDHAALHWACYAGNQKLVKFLLHKVGLDPWLQCKAVDSNPIDEEEAIALEFAVLGLNQVRSKEWKDDATAEQKKTEYINICRSFSVVNLNWACKR